MFEKAPENLQPLVVYLACRGPWNGAGFLRPAAGVKQLHLDAEGIVFQHNPFATTPL